MTDEEKKVLKKVLIALKEVGEECECDYDDCKYCKYRNTQLCDFVSGNSSKTTLEGVIKDFEWFDLLEFELHEEEKK